MALGNHFFHNTKDNHKFFSVTESCQFTSYNPPNSDFSNFKKPHPFTLSIYSDEPFWNKKTSGDEVYTKRLPSLHYVNQSENPYFLYSFLQLS